MFGIIFGAVVLLFSATWFIGYHLYDYFRDVKGLRRFPAMDPLAAFSNLSFIILSHQGFRSKRLYELHAQGHPVIRTGPNSLSYSDVRAIRDIYGHNTKCMKDEQYSMMAGTHFHLADVVDKHEHARKRKVLSSAYALKNLEEWEHKVADKTQRIIAQFDKRCSDVGHDEIVDYRSWTNFFTLDAIADIGLSKRLGFLDQGSDRCTALRPDGTTYEVNYRDCLYANSRAQSGLGWSYRWYKQIVALSKIVSPWYRKLWKLNEGWDGIYLNLATERLRRYQEGEKLDDFFQALMHDKNGNPHNLEWGEIVAEVGIMMNAGSTTTAIAMANVMYQLLVNPQCMQRLRDEIDAALDEEDIIAPYEKVKYLPYLRACLDESMRIFPPTSHGLPRVTPPEGMTILEDFIPGNTTVSMSAYVVHRDPTIFPDPEVYNPDRWLGEAGKELGPYFIAFSAGARGCIGRNISYLEQTVLLASLLHRYDIELAKPGFVPDRLETFNLHPSEVPIRLKRRHTICKKYATS
ncbi:hypothetical protein M433DRAFT_159811 [Acidomyces richmondensis BFW]|nr:MAG: hypothetical protein FE78DRAFT_91147 [Acidomyces sp. 'richmondensis']KYG40856.1 hypothetical protein M433DRAFT_159811 [Acidomyces richmondensis BFW]